MTSPKMRRRARRRAMLARGRRRFAVSRHGRFVSPHGAITYHKIPKS